MKLLSVKIVLFWNGFPNKLCLYNVLMYINYDGSVVMPYKVNILDHVYGPS